MGVRAGILARAPKRAGEWPSRPSPASTPTIWSDHVDAVRIVLNVLLVLSSMVLTLFILLHKGKGGGLSDMFGGGMSTSLGGSSVAERNLDRFTVAVALVWATAIIGLGLLARFAS